MRKIKRGTTLKGRQVHRRNRCREHKDKTCIIRKEDMKFLAKMQSASGINKALGALDKIEKLNDSKDLEER